MEVRLRQLRAPIIGLVVSWLICSATLPIGCRTTMSNDLDGVSNADGDQTADDGSQVADGNPIVPSDVDAPPDGQGAANQPPVADAGDDIHVRAGENVVLDGSDSYDPDGDALTYDWQQSGGGSAVTLEDADSARATFVAPQADSDVTLTFSLTVGDGEASNADEVAILVSAQLAPAGVLPTLSINASPTNGLAPLAVNFAAVFDRDPPDGAVVEWDFGDSVGTGGLAVSHVYEAPGQYEATACIRLPEEPLVAPICAFKSIVVGSAPVTGGGGGGPVPGENQPPVAVADVDDAAPVEGSLVTLIGNGSYDPDNGPDALTYAWTQTGGTGVTADPLFDASAANPHFTAPTYTGVASSDQLVFELTVSDGQDSSAGAAVSVTVRPPDSCSVDSDGDGSPDCLDECPNDANKTEAGVCGCGEPDADTNGNGIIDCVEVPPYLRTAEMPDSWLVLYNANSSDSVQWKTWYLGQWDIPEDNALALDVDPSAERIQRDVFEDDIYFAVYDYLTNNPPVASRVMGIIVGYRVPGSFYVDDNTPAQNGGGGWSVSNKLALLSPGDVGWYKKECPHWFVPTFGPGDARVTKATLAANYYLTARIDAPTLADAEELTTRARAITSGAIPMTGDDWLYYDYDDPGSPGGDQWDILRLTINDWITSGPPELYPWLVFESDGAAADPIPHCALMFSYYRLTGWQDADWSGAPTGPRILGFALNSFGATTVRSTTDLGGRFVPNALVNGHFAAAIGATAEPYVLTAPYPGTIVWCLSEGRTLGEAFFHSNRYTGWMWEVVADPLLRVPTWPKP